MPLDPNDIIKYKGLYLQTARAYVNDMQRELGKLIGGQDDIDAVKVIHMASHSLTSQSVLMGYASIGSSAASIEKLFKAKMDGVKSLDTAILALVDDLLKKMATSLTEVENTGKEHDLSGEIQKLQSASGL